MHYNSLERRAELPFVHLHVHSDFSFDAGVPKPEDLVRKAKALGMDQIALTDTNRMSGLILFYEACRKHNVKPILGVELTSRSDARQKVVLLAKNKA